MKSISYAIGAIALATLLIGGCSSPASPEENARAYKQHLCAGQAEKARKLVEPVFFQFFGEQVALMLIQEEAKTCQDRGGLKSFNIESKKDINESRVLFKYTIEYGKGMKETAEIAMRPVDGKWFVSAH
jgi:hypothetical protein